MTKIQELLFSAKDNGYKKFNASLIPTVNPDTVIGVRTPELRRLAKELFGTALAEDFLLCLPHEYYEENNMHAYLIEQIKDFELTLRETERFLPYIDNWATCDTFLPKTFRKNKGALIEKIRLWLVSEHTYTVRFAIGLLMRFFLDDEYSAEYAEAVSKIRSEEYYINMMIAWYFATALAKRPEDILPYLTENRLSTWVHNKTIQKAIESRRISDDMKCCLRSMRR